MNREQYRAQVDALSFSSDFQDRTMARLAQEKERKPMKKMNLKAVLLAAAVVAAMSVTAYAAITLAPRDVAQRAGNEALAAAFEGEDAITVNAFRAAARNHAQSAAIAKAILREGPLPILVELRNNLRCIALFGLRGLKTLLVHPLRFGESLFKASLDFLLSHTLQLILQCASCTSAVNFGIDHLINDVGKLLSSR